jgi:hypothetical protein
MILTGKTKALREKAVLLPLLYDKFHMDWPNYKTWVFMVKGW